jgi:TonB family protein
MKELKFIGILVVLLPVLIIQGAFEEQSNAADKTSWRTVRDVSIEAVIKGGSTEGALRDVIKEHLDEIETCYDIARKKKPGLQGRIVLNFEIAFKGRVKGLRIVSNRLHNKNLEMCVIQQIKQWHFSAPKGYWEPTVTMTIVFKARERRRQTYQ